MGRSGRVRKISPHRDSKYDWFVYSTFRKGGVYRTIKNRKINIKIQYQTTHFHACLSVQSSLSIKIYNQNEFHVMLLDTLYFPYVLQSTAVLHLRGGTTLS